MSKHTVSAEGGAMPAEGHPDAALFAIVEELIAVTREREKVQDALDDAEETQCLIETPTAVFKTERDAELMLFFGPGVGRPYDREEIAALRVMARVVGRASVSELTADKIAASRRANKILEAWGDWREKLAREEARSRVGELTDAYHRVADRHDDIAGKLATTPAVTLDGVLAKTRAWLCFFPDDAAMTADLRTRLRNFGPDEDAGHLSLTRDLVRLAKTEGGAE